MLLLGLPSWANRSPHPSCSCALFCPCKVVWSSGPGEVIESPAAACTGFPKEILFRISASFAWPVPSIVCHRSFQLIFFYSHRFSFIFGLEFIQMGGGFQHPFDGPSPIAPPPTGCPVLPTTDISGPHSGGTQSRPKCQLSTLDPRRVLGKGTFSVFFFPQIMHIACLSTLRMIRLCCFFVSSLLFLIFPHFMSPPQPPLFLF